MSLCVGFFTGQGARATQSRELPRDPDAWRLVTRETSEVLQKCWFSLLRKLLRGVLSLGLKLFSGSISYFHQSWSFGDKKEGGWTARQLTMTSMNNNDTRKAFILLYLTTIISITRFIFFYWDWFIPGSFLGHNLWYCCIHLHWIIKWTK